MLLACRKPRQISIPLNVIGLWSKKEMEHSIFIQVIIALKFTIDLGCSGGGLRLKGQKVAIHPLPTSSLVSNGVEV